MPGLEQAIFESVWNAALEYDLGLAWEWEYDRDFVQLLQTACACHGLSLLQITPSNLDQILYALKNSEITFRTFLDRATDAQPRFLELIEWVRSQDVRRINRFKLARKCWNKVFCQQEFSKSDLKTPATLVIPSFMDEPDLASMDLACLGSTFSIKPAYGGGGKGVVNEATAWEQVLLARQTYPADQYLLQASVSPIVLDGKQAWFRVLYCAGDILPCWWDTRTHIYTPFVSLPELRFLEDCLGDIVGRIAGLCGLQLFSTEIAYTREEDCVIVDYINDPIDLRLQSKAPDGVPDSLVAAIAGRIATLAAAVS